MRVMGTMYASAVAFATSTSAPAQPVAEQTSVPSPPAAEQAELPLKQPVAPPPTVEQKAEQTELPLARTASKQGLNDESSSHSLDISESDALKSVGLVFGVALVSAGIGCASSRVCGEPSDSDVEAPPPVQGVPVVGQISDPTSIVPGVLTNDRSKVVMGTPVN